MVKRSSDAAGSRPPFKPNQDRWREKSFNKTNGLCFRVVMALGNPVAISVSEGFRTVKVIGVVLNGGDCCSKMPHPKMGLVWIAAHNRDETHFRTIITVEEAARFIREKKKDETHALIQEVNGAYRERLLAEILKSSAYAGYRAWKKPANTARRKTAGQHFKPDSF